MSKPLIDFVIGGVQKAGTSALAHYLGRQPGVALPENKEAHVFDDPRFDNSWTIERVDSEYAAHFPAPPHTGLHGDATPIYLFHPAFVQRIARYNPGMKWIITLRDPVDRAISQFYMQHARGQETLPLWAALLAEPWRLSGKRNDLSGESSLRLHSYLARGRYRRQLAILYAHFPREHVLVLRSVDLLADPRHNHRVIVQGGLLATEAGQRLSEYFRRKRRRDPA